MRVEPLVMTMKLMMTRIAKITMPMTKLPRDDEAREALNDVARGAVPVCPWLRIRRVEATFSDRRSMVTTSSSVGKELNSSGRGIQSATIRISTDSDSEHGKAKVQQHRRQRHEQHRQHQATCRLQSRRRGC